MTQRLNITNGDSAAGTLSEAGVEGKIISWRDVLHEGPVDPSLSLALHSTPVAAFLEVATKQESIFLGDIIFYSYLARLSGKTDALITWKDGTPVVAPTWERLREFVEGELALTPLGREVLAGNKDWQSIHKRTRWLGGVEIKPGDGGWRWDPSKRELVRGRPGATPTPQPKGATLRTARKPSSTRKKSKTRVAGQRASGKSKPRSAGRPAPRKSKSRTAIRHATGKKK